MSTSIAFRRIAERTNLRALIEADLGPPDRSRKWRCPFHDDRNPSMGLVSNDTRFRCWSGSCGESGDAIDYVMLRDKVSMVEAARKLDPYSVPDDKPGQAPARRSSPPPAAPAPRPVEARPVAHRDPAWQAAADALIVEAEGNLWSAEGRRVRAWLAARGIGEATARRFRLGFMPHGVASEPLEVLADETGPRAIWCRRGLTIPWLAPGASYDPADEVDGPRWVGCNVRSLAADPFAPLPERAPKCQAFLGSARGFAYPWPDLLPSQVGPPALLVEGEFDALLAIQEAGHLAHPLTVGGAIQPPDRSALTFLALCPWWLLALDHDEAGIQGATQWIERGPHKSQRTLLPHGKDLTDFYVEGGDVVGWVRAEVARLIPRREDPPTDRSPAARERRFRTWAEALANEDPEERSAIQAEGCQRTL